MTQTSNWIRLLVLALVWGGSFIFIEIALRGFLPFTLVWIRVSLAAATLFAIAIAKGEAVPRELRTWGGFLCIGLLSNVAPFSLITWAQQHITAGTASILNATVPLWVVVASLCFGIGTKPTRPQVIGVIIGFLGVILLIAPKMNGGLSAARSGELCG